MRSNRIEIFINIPPVQNDCDFIFFSLLSVQTLEVTLKKELTNAHSFNGPILCSNTHSAHQNYAFICSIFLRNLSCDHLVRQEDEDSHILFMNNFGLLVSLFNKVTANWCIRLCFWFSPFTLYVPIVFLLQFNFEKKNC